MPNLEWNTLTNLDANGYATGGRLVGDRLPADYGRNSSWDGGILNSLMRGLGSLGAPGDYIRQFGGNWGEVHKGLVRDTAAAIRSRGMPNAADAALQQGTDLFNRLQDLHQTATDLASQTTSTAALQALDRLSATLSAAEQVMQQLEDDAKRARPRMPARAYLEQNQGDASVANPWYEYFDALADVDESGVKASVQQLSRLVAQATPVVAQIQTAVNKELAAQAAAQARIDAEEARRQQQDALIAQREAQKLALEEQRLQQQFALEQARATAEMQRAQQQFALEQQQAAQTAALMNQQYAPPAYTPPAYGAPAYGTPAGVPAGYVYDPATTYYYNASNGQYYNPANGQYYVAQGSQQYYPPAQQGVQYAAAPVRYAEQPAAWSYQQPSQFIAPQGPGMPLPQPQDGMLGPNWTSLEADALMEGEAKYLFRGLGDLGSDALFAAKIANAKAKLASGQAPVWSSTGVVGGPSASSKSGSGWSGPDASDVSQVISAIGQAVGQAGPAFFPGAFPQPVQQPLPERESSILPTVLVIGGGAAAAALALKAFSGSGRGGARRRR